jgi:hypothetical protein
MVEVSGDGRAVSARRVEIHHDIAGRGAGPIWQVGKIPTECECDGKTPGAP